MTDNPTNNSNRNPLLEKLTPTQFQHTVQFYEADQQLTPEDRIAISDDLMHRVRVATFGGVGTSTLMVLAPTMYARIKGIPPFDSATPLIRRPRMYKPFWSFMLSLGTMLLVNQQLCKYEFTKQIRDLEDKGASKEKQLAAWKAMDYHQAGLFFLYFKKTAEDPTYKLKDPRKVTMESLHEVRYHPSKDSHGPPDHTKWEKIRKENGFVDPLQNNTSDDDNKTNDQNEFTKGFDDNQENDEPSKPKSVWESIRSGKK